MKKIIISILCGTLILSALGFILLNLFPNTIESALGENCTIIYEEKTNGGSIVFYDNGNENNLSACFIKKLTFGYKYIYGGGGDLITPAKAQEISTTNFNEIKDTPFPLYFGVINSNDISNVKLENSQGKIFETKIIDWKDLKIWFTTIDSNDNIGPFNVIALSNENEELAKIEYTP